MQRYINVSMGDLDCLLEEWGFGASCGIFADKSKAAFHAVVPSEGAETADINGRVLRLVKLGLLSLWNRKQIHLHHSLSAGDFSYSWRNLLKNHYLGWKSLGTLKQK